MKSFFSRKLVTTTALVMSIGLGYAVAQQNSPVVSPEVSQQAQEAANNNRPLTAPPEVAITPTGRPQSFADLVEQVAPAVVNITTTAVVSQPANGESPIFPPGSPFEDLFRDFGFPGGPGQNGPSAPQRSNALGSGFVISSDGYIVTNNHVIDGADEIEIEFYNKKKLPAEVIGTDPNTDIALLKVKSDQAIPFVGFGDSDTARVGDWVLALGNPLGQGFSASTGIVSARNRELSGTYDDYLQTDAAINRGNSGGPLFDMDGKVVGVNTAILSPTGGSIGIGFSMASNVVSAVVDQLREFGETRRGWLGVSIQDVTPDIAEALGIEADSGVLVSDVPDGPAKEAGIEAQDVIVGFDGDSVSDTRELVNRVAEASSGSEVEVTVLRDGESKILTVTLGRRETAVGTGSATRNPPSGEDELLGMTVTTITPEIAEKFNLPDDTAGLVVSEVDPEGAAAEKGLEAGDVIVQAGQQEVTTPKDLQARIDEAQEAGRKSVLLLIRRGGDPRFVALEIDE